MEPYSPFYEKCLKSLKKSPIFKGLKDDLLQSLLKEFNLITWKKNSCISYERNLKYFHIIVSGRVTISKINPKSGKSITLFLLTSGDVFDLITLLEGEEHDVLIQTLDDVEILETKVEKMREWMLKHPEINRNFYPYLGKMMSQLEELSGDLALVDTSVRLGKLILNYVNKKCKDKNGHYKVDLIHDLSHEKLSQMIGTVRNVLSRHLQKMKEENIIHFKRGYISIKDIEALKKKCEEFI